jgi:hypothetical protein
MLIDTFAAWLKHRRIWLALRGHGTPPVASRICQIWAPTGESVVAVDQTIETAGSFRLSAMKSDLTSRSK